MKIQKITILGVLLAIAIVLGIVESFIPSFGVPGIKLGLANIVILLILYEFGVLDAIIVDLLRIYLTSLLRGNIFQMGFFMSLAGGILSLGIMIFLKLVFKKLSIVFVSTIGSIFHIGGQLLVALIYLQTLSLGIYLPILLISSIVCGLLVGFGALGIQKTKIIEKLKIRYNI